MESGGSQAQKGNQNCPGVGIPGQSKWSQRKNGCPGGINPVHLATCPLLLPQGGRNPSTTCSSDQRTPIRSFKQWRGYGQAGGHWGPVSLGRLEERTPLATQVSGCSSLGEGSAEHPVGTRSRSVW